MKKNLALLVVVILALIVGCAPPVAQPAAPAPEAEVLRVAFVYVAPIGDLGWTWAHEQGRLQVEATFGDQVETTYIENVPEGPDAERVIRDFAQRGYDVIFTTSFGFMDPTVNVAAEYPNVVFMHCSGYKTLDNAATYFAVCTSPATSLVWWLAA
ncbi:MAG: BMP family ABC transporter substrate-binding protein [Candidatus Shapirobacteria bacterium]